MDKGIHSNHEFPLFHAKRQDTFPFNIFARKAVREYRIPFEISGDVPNAETIEAIQEVKKMKDNPGLGKIYSNVDQMMEELLADV
ncbi:hypothetical protein FYJ39_16715 [Clostridium sp. WCA-389-WT-23D1]|uniref:Uncharacterized protein n=1 Tax=Clostridium porci TaxID=2605778 RepID=A0A7X2NNF9_9CLOT|nr:hypothetical protein [Clostridium porci]